MSDGGDAAFYLINSGSHAVGRSLRWPMASSMNVPWRRRTAQSTKTTRRWYPRQHLIRPKQSNKQLPTYIVQKLGGRLDARDQQMISRSGAGNVQQLSLCIVDLLQVGVVANGRYALIAKRVATDYLVSRVDP